MAFILKCPYFTTVSPRLQEDAVGENKSLSNLEFVDFTKNESL